MSSRSAKLWFAMEATAAAAEGATLYAGITTLTSGACFHAAGTPRYSIILIPNNPDCLTGKRKALLVLASLRLPRAWLDPVILCRYRCTPPQPTRLSSTLTYSGSVRSTQRSIHCRFRS
jgi:hypothetical protein